MKVRARRIMASLLTFCIIAEAPLFAANISYPTRLYPITQICADEFNRQALAPIAFAQETTRRYFQRAKHFFGGVLRSFSSLRKTELPPQRRAITEEERLIEILDHGSVNSRRAEAASELAKYPTLGSIEALRRANRGEYPPPREIGEASWASIRHLIRTSVMLNEMQSHFATSVIEEQPENNALPSYPYPQIPETEIEEGISAFRQLTETVRHDRSLFFKFASACFGFRPEAQIGSRDWNSISMDAKSLQTFLEGKGHIRLVPYAGWSLVNLHAIRRAIDSSPDLFATARAVSRSDAELYRWLKSGGLSKFNDTEYGLVSGFPRDAVSFFSIEGAGISRIIESYQGMERELVDVICYMGNDKDPDMRAKFLATLRKALTEKRIDAEHFQAIVRRHDVSSRILGGFVGYDRGDQEWATQQDTRFFEIFREFDSMQRPPDVRAQNPQGNTQHTQPIPGEKREPPISEMRSHTARWLDSFFLHIRNFSAHLENAFRNNALLLASA